MIKITKRETSQKGRKFEDLKPGTVFKWNSGVVSLKLRDNRCVHLFTNSVEDVLINKDWLVISDGSIERDREIEEVYGVVEEIIVS
jgi:hypothetical protein